MKISIFFSYYYYYFPDKIVCNYGISYMRSIEIELETCNNIPCNLIKKERTDHQSHSHMQNACVI